jgi:ribonuclease R
MLEGFLHISELENDYFIHDEKRSILVGRSSGKTHQQGEAIKVRLEQIDLIMLESKWVLCHDGPARPRGRFHPKRGRKR